MQFKKLLSAVLIAGAMPALHSYAQQTARPVQLTAEQQEAARKNAQANLSRMSREQIVKSHPARSAKKETELKKNFSEKSSKNEEKLLGAAKVNMPANIRVPAEHEEIQAVYISWPAYAFDSTGTIVEPYSPGISVRYKRLSNGQWVFERFVSTAGFLMDTLQESPYGPLWAQLADEIQQEVPVWIQVASPDDTTTILDYMSLQGRPLVNYKFMVNPDGSNAYWVRDSGPIGFYYGDKDSVGFMDVSYYYGREIDDLVPRFLGQQAQYPVYESLIQMEGGNFYSDGFGTGLWSSRVYEAHSNSADHNPRMRVLSQAQVRDTINNIFGLSKSVVPTTLVCDGGTGHIDMYIRPLDEERILVTEYPSVYNNSQFNDYNRVVNNVKLLAATTGPNGRPYSIVRMPLAKDDNGQYSATSCDSYNADARGFLNGIFVNKTYIFPAFSGNGSGYKAGDDEAKAIYEKLLPGYNVVPVDARALTLAGGAIHCVTMQIPAENPLRIAHASLSGNVAPSSGGFPLSATILNHSGIAEAKLMWRIKGISTWNETALVAGANDKFSAAIPGESIKLGDVVEYYIEAKSNNGKTMAKPMTAPLGHYSFTVASETSGVEEFAAADRFSSLVSPNPFTQQTRISFTLGSGARTSLTIVNSLGEKITVLVNGEMPAGLNTVNFDASGIAPGMYFARIESAGTISTIPLVIER